MDILRIQSILSTSFQKALFAASLANLNDATNKLRYTNFALSIRELSREFLHSLAPTVNVQNCDWYKVETNNGLPSRAQRICYAIQGGLSDGLLESLNFSTTEKNNTIKTIVKAIESLNKFTHVTEETFNLSPDQVAANSNYILSTFANFVETINSQRSLILKFLENRIHDNILTSVFTNFFENLDSMAQHYSLDGCYIEDYNISAIDAKEIVIDVSGSVMVTLEWGDSGDTLESEQKFPFQTKIRYSISDDFPSDDFEIDEYGIDTSSWTDQMYGQ